MENDGCERGWGEGEKERKGETSMNLDSKRLTTIVPKYIV
jgi:hypothetical protein